MPLSISDLNRLIDVAHLNYWRIKTLNTYTEKQIANSLRMLSEIFEEDQNYQDLPLTSKETFAICLLEAFQIKPSQE
jgi:hypothetical protein